MKVESEVVWKLDCLCTAGVDGWWRCAETDESSACIWQLHEQR